MLCWILLASSNFSVGGKRESNWLEIDSCHVSGTLYIVSRAIVNNKILKIYSGLIFIISSQDTHPFW